MTELRNIDYVLLLLNYVISRNGRTHAVELKLWADDVRRKRWEPPFLANSSIAGFVLSSTA